MHFLLLFKNILFIIAPKQLVPISYKSPPLLACFKFPRGAHCTTLQILVAFSKNRWQPQPVLERIIFANPAPLRRRLLCHWPFLSASGLFM